MFDVFFPHLGRPGRGNSLDVSGRLVDPMRSGFMDAMSIVLDSRSDVVSTE